MADELPLTGEDYDSVYAALAEMESRGWRRSSLNERVSAWESMVEQVEDGYAMTIDDYTDDLAVRGWLAAVRLLVTARVRTALDERLRPLDERFRAATHAPASRLSRTQDDWFHRLPSRLVGDLAEDVVSRGVLDGTAAESRGPERS